MILLSFKLDELADVLTTPYSSAAMNVPVVEKLWDMTDASGMPIVDWRSALAAEEAAVMIM